MSASTRCPACGATYPADAKFCTRDGTKLVPGVGEGPAAGRTAPRGDERSGPRTVAPPVPPSAPGARRDVRTGAFEPPATARERISHSNMIGQVLDGRYRIERKVGEGGMSFVYLAADVASSARYAIKVLSPSLARDTNAMARLRREAGLGIRLEHPNVCHIMRLGETEDGLVYIVMPFVEGELLSDREQRLGEIPLAETVKFVRDIAAGLHVAHQLRIVHRDLKPENVMIAPDGMGGERAVVLDFGLAKERRAGAELEKLTATGIVLGTPEFMSPEQLRGKQLDGRSDVYSLGLVVFEMLTGKLPFQGRTQQEMMIARLRGEPIPMREARPDLAFPEGVERVLRKALARDASDRYQTAPEFALALDQAARGIAPTEGRGGDSGIIGKLFGR
ncbi:MAG TPA: serine/threonine-protein kinase [Gemmatimonadaceae bacterium]